MPIERDLACTCRCGAKASIRAGLSWVLEDHADVLSRNAFHRFTCAACGANVSVELDFLVTNRARDRFLQVVVADAAVAEARADLARLAPGAWARIVPNRLALVEKVRLLLAREDDVAIEVAKFLRRVSLGDREGRYALHWDRVEGDGHVFAVFERGQPLGTVGVPREVVDRIVKEHDTKRFDRELEVDERLARKILDEDRRAKAAAPPAAAPPAAAPPAAAPPSAAPPGAPASSAPANAAKPDEERLGHGYVELAVAAEYVRAERARRTRSSALGSRSRSPSTRRRGRCRRASADPRSPAVRACSAGM
ncbi:MAG: CpXC domain-containing protein [Polyangiaceae bacterium]